MRPNVPDRPGFDPRAAQLPVLDRSVLVLNKSWIPIHVTTVRRAVCMVYQDIARVIATDTLQTHEFEDWLCAEHPVETRFIASTSFPIPAPEVVQLQGYNKIPNHEAPFTRQNLYHRDDHTCQYCARRGTGSMLSIDHVKPRSKGGLTTWENCVLACVKCNARKADRTLRQAGLCLLRQPRRPRWTPYMTLAIEERLSSWRRFTPASDWESSRTG